MLKKFVTAVSPSVLLAIVSAAAGAQGINSASLQKIPNEIEANSGQVQAVIDKSDRHFKQGEIFLKDRNYAAASAEFDRAVDAVLESGLDVRANPRLQTFYLQLVERVFRMEVPATGSRPPPREVGTSPLSAGDRAVNASAVDGVPAQTPGFLRDQKFEPSPLDDLAKLDLTDDEWDAVGRLPDAASACEPARLASVGLRGFRLGMTQAEVRRRLPQLRVRREAHGLSSGLALIGARQANPEFRGLVGIGFTFLDERIAGVVTGYDASINWESLDEFSQRAAEALRLPSRWHPVEVGAEPGRALVCGDLSLIATFANPYSQRKRPILQLEDGKARKTFRRRVQAAAERRRLEEERKKQSFKP